MTAVHHPPTKSERAAASVQPIHAPLNSSLPSTFLNLGPRFPGGRAQDANARLVASYCVPVGGGRVRIGSAVLAGRQSGVLFRSWQRLLQQTPFGPGRIQGFPVAFHAAGRRRRPRTVQEDVSVTESPKASQGSGLRPLPKSLRKVGARRA